MTQATPQQKGQIVRFAKLVRASAAVAATRARNAKTAVLAEVLREMDGDEIGVGATFLSGSTTQDRLGVGWAGIRELDATAATLETLTILDVDEAFAAISAEHGPGSVARRTALLVELFSRATSDEQELLRGLIHGELRQGALEGAVVTALAAAHDVPVASVRRALMLGGSLGDTATIVRSSGRAGLDAVRLVVGRAIQPMLASPAVSVAAAIADLGEVLVDDKLDGARILVHREGQQVSVHTRNLREVSDRLPEVVEVVLAMDVTSVVLDGEVIALDGDGRPLAFQETMGRFGTKANRDVADAGLSVQFFDLLHLDGDDLLDAPLRVRRERLAAVATAVNVVHGVVVGPEPPSVDPLHAAMERGQEGVVVKDLDAPYAAGRRGKTWQKVKPVHTLDLVILAVERGSGRRSSWWSNLHLGARDAETGEFVMLGKTFKGLSDDMLRWQTEHLPTVAVADQPDDWRLRLRPEVVVEIAFDGVQTSSRYPGGVALRFARVKHHRPDKPASEADTLQTIRAIHAGEIGPTPPT